MNTAIQSTKKEQTYRDLKERIENCVYAPGSRLPNEVELCVELGVSRNTLRPALEQLAMEKLIERVKGKGTFIRSNNDMRTKILVVLCNFDDISNPYIYIMPGVQLAAENLNISLEICTMTSLLSRPPDESARQILEKGIQGILWFASNFNGDEPLIETLKKTALPILFPHASLKDQLITGIPAMGTDYRKVMESGLRYLAAQGHHRVGNITTSSMRGISVNEYLQFVRDAGLDDAPELLGLTNNSQAKEVVISVTARMMEELKEPPTALFCFSDFFAVHVYEYLHGKGLRIPEDVAVLSIGGQIGCDFLNPTLSAIDFGSLEIGRNSVKVLLEMIHEKKRYIPFTATPHYITERDSTRKIISPHEYQKRKCV